MRLILFIAALLAAAPATAHVTVAPKQSVAGAHERYAILVPNEKQADMIAVEVTFPKGLGVKAFQQLPGWMTEPVRDKSGALVGARWTGRLAPQQFVELGVLAINPAAGSDLVWAAVQRFADGSSIEWSGAAGSKTPAAHVKLIKAAEPTMPAH